jgi:hypothetical protein
MQIVMLADYAPFAVRKAAWQEVGCMGSYEDRWSRHQGHKRLLSKRARMVAIFDSTD